MSDYGIETGYYRGNGYIVLVTKTTNKCIYYMNYHISDHKDGKFYLEIEYHEEPKKALIKGDEHEVSFKQPYYVRKTYFKSYRYFTLDKIDDNRVVVLPQNA